MFCVGRDKDVAAYVNAGTRTFLERDNWQPVQKVIQDLLAFRRGLGGDTVADLRRRIEDAAVVSDLGQATEATDGGCGAEGHQVAVIDLGRETSRPERIKTDVL